MTTERRTICVLGHHELDYPRNIVSQRLIRAAGYDIVLVHSRAPDVVRELALLVGLVRHRRRIDAVFVTEGGHRHVPLVKAVARTFDCPVIFDATHSVQLPGGGGDKSSGQREFAPVLARSAVAAGANGVFIETHPHPEKAMSDGPNMIPLDEMAPLLRTLVRLFELCHGQ